MSHVSECIQLYRNDLFVTNDEYGRLIQDALERDEAEADALEAPEPEPFTLDAAAVGEAILRNGRRSVPPEPATAAAKWREAISHAADVYPEQAAGDKHAAAVARLVLEQFEPPEPDTAAAKFREAVAPIIAGYTVQSADDEHAAAVAALVLEQFEQLVSTVELNGEAIALLGTADKLRRETVEALTAAVEHLTQRMNLRAEECRALNRRIDNLAAHVGRIAERLA